MTLADCARIVETGDPDRFLATMAAPPPARAVMFPLFAFNLEVARAPWVTKEPLIAEMRLQWWRDMLEEAASGAPPRAHEVAGPLHALIRDGALPVEDLDRAVLARRAEIHGEPFADTAALWDHLDATGAGLLVTAARGLNADPAILPMVRRAARAGALANWFLAVPVLTARGRRPLPEEQPEAIAALARVGLDDLATVRGSRFGPALPVMRTLWRAGPILHRAAQDPMAVIQGRLSEAEAARRGRLLWKTLTGGW